MDRVPWALHGALGSLWALSGVLGAPWPCRQAATVGAPTLLPTGDGHGHHTCCNIQFGICSWCLNPQKPRFWLPSLGVIAQRNGLSIPVLGACAVHGGGQQLRLPAASSLEPALGAQRQNLMRPATSAQECLSQDK